MVMRLWAMGCGLCVCANRRAQSSEPKARRATREANWLIPVFSRHSFRAPDLVKLFTKLGDHGPHVLTRAFAARLRRRQRGDDAAALPPHHAVASDRREADAVRVR